MTTQVIEDVEWRVTPGLTAYPDSLAEMEARVAAIRAGEARELVWLLEHPPLYTAGTSAAPQELLSPTRFPVYATGRGGRYTYHGPGQRVGYLMLDLERRGRDVRCFVASLENWLISTLGDLGVEARNAPGRVGIWVDQGDSEAKIGAIGVRIRRWVEDRRDRRAHPPLGHASRLRAQHRSGSVAFRRHHPLRPRRISGDEPDGVSLASWHEHLR
jgi:lipoyl(octanoyl) transferase